jgi:DNA-binding NarL/FixJ family response regulator
VTPTTRVVVVDDQSLVREGIKALLNRAPDIEVVGEAGDGESGVRVVRRHRPDVVLMDLRMPVMDGVTAILQLCADPERPAPAVLVLTTFDTDAEVFAAIRAGARGFLLKDTDADDLRRAVRVVAAGGSTLSPAVTDRVMRAAAAGTPPDGSAALLDELTERERAVLTEVARGHSNDEIARILFMSPATARTHVSRIMTKLGARDRAQLVVLAYRAWLLVPGSG